MSAVIAVPHLMIQAAVDLTMIGDTLSAANMAAATPTVAVPPAAADEVSTGIAHLLSGYGEDYQRLAGQAAASYEQFVQHLTASAVAYADAEAANSALLQPFAEIADSLGSAATGLPDFLTGANAFLTQTFNAFVALANENPPFASILEPALAQAVYFGIILFVLVTAITLYVLGINPNDIFWG